MACLTQILSLCAQYAFLVSCLSAAQATACMCAQILGTEAYWVSSVRYYAIVKRLLQLVTACTVF